MKLPLATTRAGLALAAMAFCALAAQAQDGPTQSLGDVARKTRKEHAAADHVPAKQLVDEEEDGPDTTGVWRVRLCSRTPCYELSVSLPKEPKWTRVAEQPRPVLIPLPGAVEDLNRVIRVYAAESLEPVYPLEAAERTFLQGRFARPEYFGRAAHIVLDEYVQVDISVSVVSHFTVAGDAVRYRGLSVVSNTPTGNYGFACVFRDQDTAAAASICDAIVKSARSQALVPGVHRAYPTYPEPPTYYPPTYDPPDNSPEGDDPQVLRKNCE